MQLGEEKHI